MTWAIVPVDTVWVPRLAGKYTKTEWAWLYGSEYAMKCIAPLLPMRTRNLHTSWIYLFVRWRFCRQRRTLFLGRLCRRYWISTCRTCCCGISSGRHTRHSSPVCAVELLRLRITGSGLSGVVLLPVHLLGWINARIALSPLTKHYSDFQNRLMQKSIQALFVSFKIINHKITKHGYHWITISKTHTNP